MQKSGTRPLEAGWACETASATQVPVYRASRMQQPYGLQACTSATLTRTEALHAEVDGQAAGALHGVKQFRSNHACAGDGAPSEVELRIILQGSA